MKVGFYNQIAKPDEWLERLFPSPLQQQHFIRGIVGHYAESPIPKREKLDSASLSRPIQVDPDSKKLLIRKVREAVVTTDITLTLDLLRTVVENMIYFSLDLSRLPGLMVQPGEEQTPWMQAFGDIVIPQYLEQTYLNAAAPVVAPVVEHLARPVLRVLAIGDGPGHVPRTTAPAILRFLQNKGNYTMFQTYATEISPIIYHAPGHAFRVDVHKLTESLDLVPESFDLVIAESMLYMGERSRLGERLSQIVKMLTKDGVFVHLGSTSPPVGEWGGKELLKEAMMPVNNQIPDQHQVERKLMTGSNNAFALSLRRHCNALGLELHIGTFIAESIVASKNRVGIDEMDQALDGHTKPVLAHLANLGKGKFSFDGPHPDPEKRWIGYRGIATFIKKKELGALMSRIQLEQDMILNWRPHHDVLLAS